NSLVVSAGTTLDLNGLHVYARVAQVAGLILGGTVNQVAPGPLALGVPTPSYLGSGLQTDEWSFFGRAGQAVTVVVNTSGSSPGFFQPYLNYATVQILDSSNKILALATNTQSGADVSLLGVRLPADGSYRVH